MGSYALQGAYFPIESDIDTVERQLPSTSKGKDMQAIVTTGDNDLTLAELGVPVPGPQEVRIAVDAAAVNPVDVQTRRGIYHQLGWIDRSRVVGLGWDVAGRIDAVGDGVGTWSPGTYVVALHDGLDSPTAAYAGYVVVPESAIAAAPTSTDAVGAATLPLNALTAMQALDMLGEPDGRTLLVTGAAGGVGGFALPLAARRGWAVSGLARGEDEEFVRASGALFVSTTPPARTFDAVFDTAALGAQALDAIRDGGRYVGVIPSSGPPAVRGVEVTAVVVHHDGEGLAELVRLVDEGMLAVRTAGTFPLEKALDAHAAFERGGTRGRWVLTVSENARSIP
ncbi:NADP-dependent oxidoreductase [Rhodococcus sovatensis]|uniref:NADP-dependent oxidoreductase n=1 Tax=Rhodococcus sovatensis TaxID=1805840 RepID=A0ABZ2PUE4_9NOCA